MTLMTLITNWRSGRMAGRELASFDADGLQALARDVGLSPDGLARLASRGAAGGELPRLLSAVGLAPERMARTHADVMRDMSVVCSGCAAARRCRRDLDRGWVPVVQRYCPNAVTIKALQAERCRAVP
ncbi:hypothetical protein [Microvirga sp. G4-2]|uniref:hypothetical protein n=1 Tax=Microvirga sp. G4-2 TaxID=3434467 RepID=UPI00404448A5